MAARFDFTDKTVLVTGAGRGIGRAIAKALVSAGATTYALSKTQANLDSLVRECPSIRAVCVDLSDWNQSKSAIESLGPIDFLVNNAGVIDVYEFMDIDEASFDRIISVNLKAVIAVSQVVAKQLMGRKMPGAIVNISSICGLSILPGPTVYTASKAALNHLTRAMAVELGMKQIRVNAICPTMVETDMLTELASGIQKATIRYTTMDFQRSTPINRIASVEEMTGAVLFLLSDSASMINGAVIPVEGGAIAHCSPTPLHPPATN
jgi:L-xylulose reductase